MTDSVKSMENDLKVDLKNIANSEGLTIEGVSPGSDFKSLIMGLGKNINAR
jgi:hypothetical protein